MTGEPREGDASPMRPRLANAVDHDWIAEVYRTIRFVPSPPDAVHVVAEEDGQRVGLGRLTNAGPGAVELGGMYVAESHRGRGLARTIVMRLLEEAGERRVYCVPFVHLVDFYRSCGLADPPEGLVVPAEVEAKMRACDGAFDEGVTLLVRL